MKHFGVKFSDFICIGFRDIVWKNRRTVTEPCPRDWSWIINVVISRVLSVRKIFFQLHLDIQL